MADDNDPIKQDDIEQLLAGSGSSAENSSDSEGGDALSQSDIEALLSGSHKQTGQATSESPMEAEDADKLLGQADIERLLDQAGKSPPPVSPTQAREKPASGTFAGEGEIVAADVELLLRQAEEALASVDGNPARDQPAGLTSFRLEQFSGAPPSKDNTTLDLIRDVELDVKIELGRTDMYLEDVLRLRRGSVVPLDKLAGDPVDIYVNGRLIARGEVLVLNDNFCVRIAELIAGASSE